MSKYVDPGELESTQAYPHESGIECPVCGEEEEPETMDDCISGINEIVARIKKGKGWNCE